MMKLCEWGRHDARKEEKRIILERYNKLSTLHNGNNNMSKTILPRTLFCIGF